MPHFSWIIFLVLLIIFGASLAMFLALVRRWTTQRQWVSLAQWARQRGLKFSAPPRQLPAVLAPLGAAGLQIRLCLCDKTASFLQLQTDPPPGRTIPDRWNVLLFRTPQPRSGLAALRPAAAPASLLDLMGLSQFPALKIAHRFVVLSTTSSAARLLAHSASRTLVPADIGLLAADQCLLLDFSSRPFDPIELDRILAIARQLHRML